jgi:hypothetical protein
MKNVSPYQVGTGGFLQGSKAARLLSYYSPVSVAEVKIGVTVLPFPHTSSGMALNKLNSGAILPFILQKFIFSIGTFQCI